MIQITWCQFGLANSDNQLCLNACLFAQIFYMKMDVLFGIFNVHFEKTLGHIIVPLCLLFDKLLKHLKEIVFFFRDATAQTSIEIRFA